MLALRHFFPAVAAAASQTGTDPTLCYAYAMLMLMLALRHFFLAVAAAAATGRQHPAVTRFSREIWSLAGLFSQKL